AQEDVGDQGEAEEDEHGVVQGEPGIADDLGLRVGVGDDLAADGDEVDAAAADVAVGGDLGAVFAAVGEGEGEGAVGGHGAEGGDEGGDAAAGDDDAVEGAENGAADEHDRGGEEDGAVGDGVRGGTLGRGVHGEDAQAAEEGDHGADGE